MKLTTYFLSLFIGFTVIACNTPKQETKGESQAGDQNEGNTNKDVSQLTYNDVVEMVFNDDGERIEWHGEEMPNELIGFLTISEGNACGEVDCGKNLIMNSTADTTMIVVVRGDYDLKGDQGYIPRKYTITPGQELSIGCSHLCYNNESYEFSRTIVGSSYVTE